MGKRRQKEIEKDEKRRRREVQRVRDIKRVNKPQRKNRFNNPDPTISQQSQSQPSVTKKKKTPQRNQTEIEKKVANKLSGES